MLPWKHLKTITRGNILENEPLSKHTSFGIGGPARFIINPLDKQDLIGILKFANKQKLPVFFLGSGSNLLVSDKGYEGLVISLGKSFKKLTFEGNLVNADAGVMLGKLVKNCKQNQLTGMEGLIGVPGTLGGAIFMNAGAFGSEISKKLQEVTVISLQGIEKQYNRAEMTFGYRSSNFTSGEIIIAAKFELKSSVKSSIHDRQKQSSETRKNSQPLKFRSAGSIFKNPGAGKPAGYLIDQAGLKGIRIGGAEISSKHANFIININNATAENVAQLIGRARKKVYKSFGINLELEIKTLGFEPGKFDR
ncbi:MAG: UDP-N-acetylmuramate dehydrogenase [Candidatus Neomarinimicrobiota bacterium]